ncbi:hypothetical protein CNECB9_30032 [Cupriavidus necator]|uniref:Uncharacterized protein n=1 Tax=Cupriavidus necator TaxID=106590 RepID=A0A1K0ITS3_CUPNE|nr:hypothetical protein CNECB9_30032 [Cupriavidus necator]
MPGCAAYACHPGQVPASLSLDDKTVVMATTFGRYMCLPDEVEHRSNALPALAANVRPRAPRATLSVSKFGLAAAPFRQ